jgi:hypothetical protein
MVVVRMEVEMDLGPRKRRAPERTLHGIGGISASCHAMPLLLANITFHVNYLVE